MSMKRRINWCAIPFLVALSGIAANALGAQTPGIEKPSEPIPMRDGVTAAILQTARGHLDAERYAEALTLVTEYLRSSRVAKRDRLELLQVGAVAAYPAPNAAGARPDSSRALLAALVRLEPEAALFEEYRWVGLDSILSDVKAKTFGAAVRWRSRYEMTGDFAPATIAVVATRAFKAQLLIQRRGVGETRLLDTASGDRGATLRLFAHDGRDANISEGEWQLQVIMVDKASGESVTLPSVGAIADGQPPSLMPRTSALDTTLILPEWQPPARVTGIGMGLVLAVSSVAIASAARANGALREQSGLDRRAASIGIIGGLGAAIAGWFDKGRPLVDNIARNRALREEYAYRSRFIDAFNKTNVANYRVKLTLDPESLR